jgi:spermidine synthase
MLVVLTLLFILSGAAGLFYESVWSRYLGLFVGHNAYAQVIVLVIFLGGMAIGAMLVGRVSARIREPLFGYAIVEALVGLLGLFFQDIYVGVTDWAYASVFPATAGSVTLTIAKWGLAALLILPQSILLGTTFPLMSAGALRRLGREPGRTLSVLYFANSFGAAIGVLIAGFYLVDAVGLPGTILAATIINFVVAIGAVVASKYVPAEGEMAPAAEPAASGEASAAPGTPLVRVLLGVAFGTAVASFVYEIAWIRMLSLVLSSATHSFELMLSAFILGLALGAFWVRRRADRFADPLRTLGVVQLWMGALALATLPLYFAAFDWMATLLATFARTESGYAGLNLARYGICLLVMLPATFCAGITLPLITRTLLVGGSGERAIGQVYGWNTLGSIFGVAIAALVLLPLVGLKALLATGALLDMAIGAAVLWWAANRLGGLTLRRSAMRGSVAVAAVALVAIVTPGFDQSLLLSGVFRYGVKPAPGSREVLYYADGRTATVSAERIKETGLTFIATNGKSDGGMPAYWTQPCSDSLPKQPLRGDAATLALAALITLAHAPEAKVGAVIGQGTGISSHLLLGSEKLEALYTIEIEPEMLDASKVGFYPANARVFDDPRSHFVVDDAKSYFAAAGRQYDFIFSEPSQPWVSGVAGLFTREFYQRVNRYLTPGGVFAQWIHIYDINDRLVMTVLSALHAEFKNYEVYMPAATDMLVVATNADRVPAPDWRIFQYPAIARDFCHQIPFTPEALDATWLGNRRTLGPLVERFPTPNSDFFPHLDNGAELSRYMGQQASGIYGLSNERFDISGPVGGRRILPASFTQAPTPDIPRVFQLSVGATLRTPAAQPAADQPLDDDRKGVALYRDRAWRAELASASAPANWRVWLQRMADIERDRYGGTRGYADPAFYGEIYRFLERHRAPAPVRAVVEFREGILGWNWAPAARAAGLLIPEALAGRSWLAPDELRDGAVLAYLATNQLAEARRTFESLASLSRRPPNDFRSALLAAYVEVASAAEPRAARP